MSSSSRPSFAPAPRQVILSIPVPVETLRVGDCVDFGPNAVPPRVWRVHSIRDGETRAIQFVLPLPFQSTQRRWVGRYPKGRIMHRVPDAVVTRMHRGVFHA